MRFLILFSFAVLAVFVSLISMGAAHAAITVEGPYIDTTTQGDWRNTFAAGGSCFYLLPKPPEVPYFEYPINPKDPNDPGHYCSGGSYTTNGKLLSWDMFSLNGGSTVRPMYVWYFDPTDPVTETRPLSDGTHPADQWNPCVNQGSGGFLGATFDNGDNVNGYFQPMVSEVSVDVIGSLRVAYYFLEEFKDHCRKQTYKLFINGTEYAAGFVMDLDTGKYVYFNIDGLAGASTIRLEMKNTNYEWLDGYPCGNPIPGNPAGSQYNVPNIHFSGIFIDKCNNQFQGCTPGYWKQSQHFGSWVGYSPVPTATKFSAVFGMTITVQTKDANNKKITVTDPTLLEALNAEGGDVNALARHATAALLNAANPDVYYPRSVAGIISMVQAALSPGGDIEGTKNTLAGWNESYWNGRHNCPLGSNSLPSTSKAAKSK